jgi:small-conductance mechanosensitive channel
LGVALVLILIGRAASAQALPGIPGLPAPAEKAASKAELAAPTKDNPEATVAESPGKIDVNKPVDETRVKEFLEGTLAKYPGVDEIHAEVNGSVVTLTGHVDDEQVRDRIGQVALKVEGVVFVANQVKTDAQFLSAPQILFKRLGQYGGAIGQNWLLFLLSLALLSGAMLAARLFSRYSEVLLAPFTENTLLRSVLGSLVSAAIVAGGLLAALQVFGAASAVMSVLGLAGVAALAVGFAFRDITENFIASILLSARRPFHVGDYVEVAGRAGVVKALNTRATVLLTLDGKTIRIPNATVFKEIVTNASAATSSRSTFDVLIPYEASTVRAMELIGDALKGHEAILDDPPPRVLVEELTPEGVKLRTHFWMPTHGVDGLKVNSDAKLKAKVALQEAGIRPPSTMLSLALASRVGVDVTQVTPEDRSLHEPAHRPPVVTETQARANLARDSRAADKASDVKPQDQVIEHVRNMSTGDAAAEGANLLARRDPQESPDADVAAPPEPELEPATSDR